MKTLGKSFSTTLGIMLGIVVFFVMISFILSFFDKYLNFSKENYSFLEGDKNSLNKIAIIELNGIIMNQSKNDIPILNSQIIYASDVEKMLEEFKNEPEIKAIIISINSPGGSVSGSNRFYNAIRNFKKNNERPILIHTNELLASGAIWSTIGADKIYASYGSMIGSIGVKGPSWFVYNNPTQMGFGILGPNISTSEGIDHYQPYAGKSKDIFNSFREPTNEELETIQKMIDSIYDKFLHIVSSNRKIDKEYIEDKIGAIIFDSNEAKYHNLIDEVINLKELKQLVINSLNLKNDYQIIKVEDRFNLINEISNIILKIDYNKQIYNDICNLSDQQVLLLSNYNFSVCQN